MYKITKAELTDLNQLVPLFDAYRVFYKYPSNVYDAEVFLKERITHAESVIYLALSKSGIAVGFAQLYPLFSSTRMKRLWLLNDLYVDEIHRGKGVSVMLIDAAKKLCMDTGACALTLETAKTNFIGNNLYIKTGFNLDQDHNYYEWTNK